MLHRYLRKTRSFHLKFGKPSKLGGLKTKNHHSLIVLKQKSFKFLQNKKISENYASYGYLRTDPSIAYDNPDIYNDIFFFTRNDQKITKLVNSFSFTPVMFGIKDIESQPVIIVSNELAELSYEQFNNLLEILYNWFGSNFHFDQ